CREVGRQAGLEVARFDHSLGAAFTDFNRDGRLDLYVANDEDPNRLYTNVAWPGGAKADPARLGFRLEERGAAEGVADPNAGMGVASTDYDGNVDIAINSIGGPLVLLENTNTSGHWLEVGLKGFHPGTQVTAVLPDGRRIYREVQAGSSYLSSEDPRLHFGLGDATKVSE